ncbi:MAG: hypothetical protein LBU11_11010 [Zoogloeaceae bacterium]|nr:hypothetical protein [Zoogloeaceae bacterium]
MRSGFNQEALAGEFERGFALMQKNWIGLRITMNEFHQFLEKMGRLHDAIASSIVWSSSEMKLEFIFEDMYRNHHGLPEYPGAYPGRIVLYGVRDLSISLDPDEKLWIHEFLLPDRNQNEILVGFCPSGEIRAKFSSVEYSLFNKHNPES